MAGKNSIHQFLRPFQGAVEIGEFMDNKAQGWKGRPSGDDDPKSLASLPKLKTKPQGSISSLSS